MVVGFPMELAWADVGKDYDVRTPGVRSDELTDLTTVQAYALQAEIARLRERRGENVIGYKVGCTSKSIQVQLGVQEPIFGRIFDTGIVIPSGRGVSLGHRLRPTWRSRVNWRSGCRRICRAIRSRTRSIPAPSGRSCP